MLEVHNKHADKLARRATTEAITQPRRRRVSEPNGEPALARG